MLAKDPRFEQLYLQAKEELCSNILPFWMNKTLDETYGGFYGACEDDGTPIDKASKCLILGARLIWSFASAYRVMGDPAYKAMAKRAYDYFLAHFLDKEYGGAYYMLDYKGDPEQDMKMIYGQAFVIYAFSEYARATGDQDAITKALEIFELIEKHAYDPTRLGYFELCDRDWSMRASQESNINEGVDACKTMNTHLHLIEGYTSLLRVWRNERMESKVKEHLDVMLDKIVDQAKGHYIMFFREDWSKSSNDISYGHDIEGTWLMMETCEVLGNQAETERAIPICLHMADACLKEGVNPNGSMVYEFSPDQNHVDTRRSWWVQAEAVIGFLNAWELSGEDRYLAASVKAFEYIRTHIVDHKYGEWFPMLDENEQPVSSNERKVSGWKAPYHNSRMCLEIIERYQKHFGKA